mgnify:CR=1 FL=1
MPLHTGFHPTCAVAFCPIYDTARQNFASKVRRSSWENHLFRFHCAKHSEKPLKAKIVSAMASTIFESYLHCLEWNWNVLFCSLGRSTLLVMTVAPVRGFCQTGNRKNGFICSFVPVWFSSTDIKNAKRLCWSSYSTTVFWNKNYFSL